MIRPRKVSRLQFLRVSLPARVMVAAALILVQTHSIQSFDFHADRRPEVCSHHSRVSSSISLDERAPLQITFGLVSDDLRISAFRCIIPPANQVWIAFIQSFIAAGRLSGAIFVRGPPLSV